MNIALLVVMLAGLALVVEIAAVMLKLTGIPMDDARFEALSILVGAGFTTSKSERITSSPARRRIAFVLMWIGPLGFAFVISTLVGATSQAVTWREAGLAAVIALVTVTVLSNHFLLDLLDRTIAITVEDQDWLQANVASVMQIGEGYAISQLVVEESDPFCGQQLARAQIRELGLLVLTIERDSGELMVNPKATDPIQAGDKLLLYGPEGAVHALKEERS